MSDFKSLYQEIANCFTDVSHEIQKKLGRLSEFVIMDTSCEEYTQFSSAILDITNSIGNLYSNYRPYLGTASTMFCDQELLKKLEPSRTFYVLSKYFRRIIRSSNN